MKKLLFILPVLLIFSCTVQKRKYQHGYYVSWHKKYSKKETTSLASTTKNKEAKSENPEKTNMNEQLFASVNNDLSSLKLIKSSYLVSPPEDSCDVLIFKDGAEIKAKIKEIDANEIRYKRCDSQDGPMYVCRKSEIFMIKYSNGTREVIRAEEPERPRTQPVEYKPKVNKYDRADRSNYKRQVHPLGVSSLVLGIGSAIVGYILLVALMIGISLPVTILFLPLLLGLVAVVTGIMAAKSTREAPDLYRGKGLYIAGIVVGSVASAILLMILMLALLLA